MHIPWPPHQTLRQDSQPGAVCPQETWATSGGTSGYHNWGARVLLRLVGRGIHASKHPTKHRTAPPPPPMIWNKKISSTEGETLLGDRWIILS